MFFRFQIVVFSGEESTTVKDVFLPEDFLVYELFYIFQVGDVTGAVNVTYGHYRTVSIHTMRIHRQFAMDVPHQDDATSQTESQSQQVNDSV